MDEPVAATTTREEDRASAGAREALVAQSSGERDAEVLATHGQRRVNLIWELTQASLAVLTPAFAFAVATYLVIYGDATLKASSLTFLTGTTSLIIGFYFSRTNHSASGGVESRKRRGE